jgi:hypothetical protein
MANRGKEREEFLSDIIITAVEGGINYWAGVSNYNWSMETPSTTKAVIYDLEEPETELILSINTIASAVNRVQSDGNIHGLGDFQRGIIIQANITNDFPSWFDAITADIVAQIATLGEVIYG